MPVEKSSCRGQYMQYMYTGLNTCNHFPRTSEKTTGLLLKYSTGIGMKPVLYNGTCRQFFGSGTSLDHQLKFGVVVRVKLEWTRAAPLKKIPDRVICASRSLQGALLNCTVLRGFLSMLHINLLSPSSGRLNLFQVNCFTPSSGCQCSIQLKQIITNTIKPNVHSKHWDKHPTWCRDPKYNVSWRGSTLSSLARQPLVALTFLTHSLP